MKFKRYTDVAVVFVLSILLLILSAFITANSLVASMVVTELALLLPALLFVILRKDNISCRFALKLPSIGNFFSSILIFVGMNALQNAVTFVLYPLYYNKTENPDIGMLDSFEGVSPYVLLIAIAVMPAICEEMLFRGYFLSAFTQNKTKLSAILGISISSIMFSILHFSIYKLPMTLIMGIAFAYIAYKSGSILISGIFHFLTNANALISYYTLMGADSEPVTALVLKDLSYVFISVIYLMAAVLFISLGVRSFKEKKTNKKRFIIYIAVLLVIAILVSLGALVLTAVNEMEIVTLIESSTEGKREEKFTLDKNTLCFVASMFNAKDVEMAITDQEGKVVYEYTEGMSQLMLEKGEYTIEINCSVTDKNSKLDSVKYIVEIISFAEFEITDTAEDDGEPGGIDFSESY